MHNIILILRGIQALLAVVTLGLIAYFVNWVRERIVFGSLDSANFLLFDSIWTLFIALPFIVFSPKFFPALAHQYALLGVEAATVLFWFSAFISLAVDTSNIGECTVCSVVKAAIAFGAFEWWVIFR
ncbi:hypothetical protein H112_00653 [Trichophyton rubrum D6]|uniref:MARVEL domain-containing protein n=2 Tax=Trichophyton TaxID=5550 RepID=A0A022WFW6_TRIRU|nr:hypothetical protein H100_00653 [Trichophyton rubrum MR850]EZF46404.1 hypothetical protein H102_00650 [Trichophyton rubrum CBS 100081]EZF57026.1 hypothetical protein H103_00652 [Trichophyton rubrum CBS 288.86]EZF67659.1 hypothetical protein H104_00639 [Trichophyton rubrum CBS 289.86]EZF78252.1 hypothetical protein H105_00648 [Trichophyton soudanense CBS 452.61]EZF88959.1 hypothetical protein H110_00657 [Trichophyton rubrum MR1448]EZG21331.1 hypothetical protein H107_00697 [Trichophyton rub